MSDLQQTIQVKINAIVAGLKEVQKLQGELKGLEKAAGKKLSVNTGGAEAGASRLSKLFGVLSGAGDGAVKSVSGVSKGLGGLMGALNTVVSVGTGPIGILLAIGSALFGLAKEAADAGSEIYDATVKTGFMAETLSGMKNAVEASGGSFEGVTGSLNKFNVNLAAARDQGSKMSPTFKALGNDINDNEAALRKAFKILNSETDATKKAQKAKELFGKSYGDVLGVIAETNGDLDLAIKKYDAMGTLIGGEAARNADKFGDELTQMWQQLKGLGRQIGETFTPVITVLTGAFGMLVSAIRAVGDAIEWVKNKMGGSWADKALSFLRAAKPGLTLGIAMDNAVQGMAGSKKKPGDDETKSTGGAKDDAAKKRHEAALKQIKYDEQVALRWADFYTKESEEKYQKREIDLKTHTANLIKQSKAKLDATWGALEAEKLALETSGLKESETLERLQQIQIEKNDAWKAYFEDKFKLEQDSAQTTEQLEKEHQERLSKIDADAAQARILQLQDDAEHGKITYTAAEESIIAIQAAALAKRGLAALTARNKERAGTAEYVRLDDAYQALQGEAAAFKEDVERRKRDAAEKTLDKEKAAQKEREELARKAQEDEFNRAEQVFSSIENRKNADIEDVQGRVGSGELSELEGRRQILEITRQYRGELEQALATLLEIAIASNDPAQIEHVKQLMVGLKQANREAAGFGATLRSASIDEAASGLTNMFTDIATGAKTAKEAVLDFVGSFLQALEQLIIQMIVVKILQIAIGAFGGGASGASAAGGSTGSGLASIFPGFADGGGPVDGPGTATSDSILARLSKGEFVIRAASVRKLGTGFLDYINTLGRPPEMPGFAFGGAASNAPGTGPEALLAALQGGGNTTNNINFKEKSARDRRVPSKAVFRDMVRTLRGAKT